MRLGLILFAASLAIACDDGATPDAGADGGFDAALRDAEPPDAPAPMCAPGCDDDETCCADPTGGDAVCYALRNDPEHCGTCGTNCVAANRGDACQASQCSCRVNPLGCRGTVEDFCCPAREEGGQTYCANLATSALDCGDCDAACDIRTADRCDGGRCVCGSREPCEGTPESTCCVDEPDVGCVDTTTDRFHCGECENLCQGAERCEDGTCTRGASCGGACELGQVCCDGVCCSRRGCLSGACMDPPAPDGGAPDAGAPDAGAPDGG